MLRLLLALALTAPLWAADDGFPPEAKLSTESDRDAFRRWTCAVAMRTAGARDCADLMNIAYREALKRHDQAWRDASGWMASVEDPAKDVSLGYPVPILGTRLHRAVDGPFDPAAVGSQFAPYATSQALREFNARRLGKDLSSLKDGDLLFFQHPWQVLPDHGMLYCGGLLVYHTGPSPAGPGRVKRVRLERLLAHPDPRWRPVPSNPYFLGVYRWKILD